MTGYKQDAARRNAGSMKPRDEVELGAAILTELESFAPGWDPRNGGTGMRDRLVDIVRFWRFNSEEVIQKSDRDEIARLANALLGKLSGLRVGGLDQAFLDTLRALAKGSPPRKGRGGDHRSRKRSLRSSVMCMIVRLYLAACRT